MTAIDIAVICLMAICLVVAVGEPLARRRAYSERGAEGDNDTERLLLQKEMLYGAIRDLDFDFQTSKVDRKTTLNSVNNSKEKPCRSCGSSMLAIVW